ncbi:IS110 family transposase [Pseudonocardia nigra]|uniref:IS110 family transposase n=1 Tax=Pseudonocardia nigra TaxID=1921578 RepID=UPI001C5F76E1|nr:IS110 family transposase [Pseudonocardia nigra]
MAIVGGLDLHRKQITFDVVDTDTGELRRGRISPADRQLFRGWLAGFVGQHVELAVEGCTGWRFVIEECQAAGVIPHLAEPADVAGLRGRRRHAKTDRIDARHLRDLLLQGRLPECWIPPQVVLETRAKVRLYKDLADQRTGWQQRMHATLYHLGAPAQRDLLVGDRARLARIEGLTPAARQAITVALRMIDALDVEIDGVRGELVGFARRQPGCRALQAEFGIGALLSVVIWCEMGDARRFAHSRDVVRHSGLDITVYSSDGKRSPGRLSRQGVPLLRWALYEAGRCAARAASPDHAYYNQVTDRLGGQRAALSVARKLARRCYHRLRVLGDEALAPPPPPRRPARPAARAAAPAA